MVGSGPPEGVNPFEGMPLFGDLQRLFAAQGPVNWDIARQVGVWTAAEGVAESNVDPLTRIRFEELARVAELHVADATGLADVGCRPPALGASGHPGRMGRRRPRRLSPPSRAVGGGPSGRRRRQRR